MSKKEEKKLSTITVSIAKTRLEISTKSIYYSEALLSIIIATNYNYVIVQISQKLVNLYFCFAVTYSFFLPFLKPLFPVSSKAV